LEWRVLTLLLTFVLVWAGLVVLLAAGAALLQSTFYSDPVPGIVWRAPTAALLLTLFLAFWGYLDYGAPGRYGALFAFSPYDEKTYPEIRALVVRNGRETQLRYRLSKNTQGLPEYRPVTPPFRPLPTHPDAIIVVEDDQEHRFMPERDAKGRFVYQQGQALRYIDDRGRVMWEDSIGRLSTFRWGRFWANLLLNAFHLGLWFICLWLVLRFQWSHALGLGLACWLAMTVLIVPMILSKVEESALYRPMTHAVPRARQDQVVRLSPAWQRLRGCA
jgi:hypothetical protein